MRVLELGKYYPPVHGGMETVLREECRGLTGRGHEVYAVVAAASRSSVVENLDGATIHRAACWGRIRSLPVVPQLAPVVRRALREFDPQVVHLHLPNPGAVLAWSVAGDRRPTVVTYHSDIVRQRWLARLWIPWRDRLLQDCVTIVATSESLLESSETLRPLRHKCEVVPLGIDLTPFDDVDVEAVERARDQWGPAFLLFVGRLVYYKGLDVLLEALQGTDLRLVVVGDGPLRNEVALIARRRRLQDQVVLLGDVSDVRLRALYHACTALVLPSTAPSEAFGLVQLEAMACRRPVVASRASGGVASVQQDGVTGLLVEPRDATALREALLRVWSDETFAASLGQAGRSRVEALYDSRLRAGRLEAVLSAAYESGRSTTP